MLNTISTKIHT